MWHWDFVMVFVSYPKAYIGLPFPKRAVKQNLAVVHFHVVTFERGICRINHDQLRS